MSHVTRTLYSVLQSIKGHTETDRAAENFSFMKGWYRKCSPRTEHVAGKMYSCASSNMSKVQHPPLHCIKVLHNFDVNGKDITLFLNLYWEQETATRWRNEVSEWVNIERGARQGYVLPPGAILHRLQRLWGIKITRELKQVEEMSSYSRLLEQANDVTILQKSTLIFIAHSDHEE